MVGETNSTAEVISKFKKGPNDTGSTEVQVALLTKRLEKLSGHFSTHTKDNHSKRGMLSLVSQRAKLLNYLKEKDVNRYRDLVTALGLRK